MWHATSADDMAQAVDALKRGDLVAFPTETVYGLGGNGLSADSCRAIYAAKGRPSDNPLILHISDMAMLDDIASDVPEAAHILADAFWPGPLTLILPRNASVPDAATGGLNTVAVRFPDHPVAQALIRGAGVPIAAPSANSSGKPSPTAAWHVAEDLGDRIAGIVDGGPTDVGIESTIIDCTRTPAVLLRPGGIAREAIEALIGPVLLAGPVAADDIPQAPGMKYRHYAPSVPVYRLPKDGAATFLRPLCEGADGPRLGLLLADEDISALGTVPARILLWNMGSRTHPEMAAHRLFDGLRRLDDAIVDEMFISDFPETGIGLGVMNRIRKLSRPLEERET